MELVMCITYLEMCSRACTPRSAFTIFISQIDGINRKVRRTDRRLDDIPNGCRMIDCTRFLLHTRTHLVDNLFEYIIYIVVLYPTIIIIFSLVVY